jgi:hypothetical protein
LAFASIAPDGVDLGRARLSKVLALQDAHLAAPYAKHRDSTTQQQKQRDRDPFPCKNNTTQHNKRAQMHASISPPETAVLTRIQEERTKRARKRKMNDEREKGKK